MCVNAPQAQPQAQAPPTPTVQQVIQGRLDQAQMKTAQAEAAQGMPSWGVLDQMSVPDSVKVAAQVQSPEQWTPELLQQLAEDWQRAPVDTVSTAAALSIQAQEKQAAPGWLLPAGVGAGAALAGGAAGYHKGRTDGIEWEQRKDPAQIQMAYTVGARRGFRSALAHQQALAQANAQQPAKTAAVFPKSLISRFRKSPKNNPAASATPPAPNYNPAASATPPAPNPPASAPAQQGQQGGRRWVPWALGVGGVGAAGAYGMHHSRQQGRREGFAAARYGKQAAPDEPFPYQSPYGYHPEVGWYFEQPKEAFLGRATGAVGRFISRTGNRLQARGAQVEGREVSRRLSRQRMRQQAASTARGAGRRAVQAAGAGARGVARGAGAGVRGVVRAGRATGRGAAAAGRAVAQSGAVRGTRNVGRGVGRGVARGARAGAREFMAGYRG